MKPGTVDFDQHHTRQRALYGHPTPAKPNVPATLESLRRGLSAAADQLSALERRPDVIAVDALVHQLAGLHREAQRLRGAQFEGKPDAAA